MVKLPAKQRPVVDGPAACLDSERIEPFVDITRFFAEKWHHWAFPRRIEKQTLFPDKWHHGRARTSLRVLSPPHPTRVGLAWGRRIRTRLWVYSGMLALTDSALAPYCHRRHGRPARIEVARVKIAETRQRFLGEIGLGGINA